MIKLEDIAIGYHNTLLSAGEITLEKGQVFVLIGRNGSGKTTLLKTILGEIKPIKGRIEIDGTPLSGYKGVDLPKKIAFVPSTFPPTSFVKAIDFVALGRSPYTNSFGRLTEADLDIVNASFDNLGIVHLKDKFTTDLSDGEKQLVGIAKALAQETDYILLDEPLAFLDYTNRKMVLEKLQILTRDHSKCILFSSHDIDIILEFNFSYILINKVTRQLNQKGADFTKRKIIEICF